MGSETTFRKFRDELVEWDWIEYQERIGKPHLYVIHSTLSVDSVTPTETEGVAPQDLRDTPTESEDDRYPLPINPTENGWREGVEKWINCEPLSLDDVLDCTKRWGYLPDGKPPDGYEVRRDFDVAGMMTRHQIKPRTIADAVFGLRLLVEHGDVNWIEPGDKFTLRALWRTEHGVRSMFSAACEAATQQLITLEHDELAEIALQVQ
jgi:hypothetical protein